MSNINLTNQDSQVEYKSIQFNNYDHEHIQFYENSVNNQFMVQQQNNHQKINQNVQIGKNQQIQQIKSNNVIKNQQNQHQLKAISFSHKEFQFNAYIAQFQKQQLLNKYLNNLQKISEEQTVFFYYKQQIPSFNDLDLLQFTYQFNDRSKIHQKNVDSHNKFQKSYIQNQSQKIVSYINEKQIDALNQSKLTTLPQNQNQNSQKKFINFKQLKQQNHVVWKAIFNQFRKAFRVTIKSRIRQIPRLLIPKNGSLSNFQLIMSFLELKHPQLMPTFISYVFKRFQDVFNRTLKTLQQNFKIEKVELNKSNKEREWIKNQKETVEKYLDKLEKYLFQTDYKQRIKILYIRKNVEAQKRILRFRKLYTTHQNK